MASITKRGNSYKITVSCGYDITQRQIRKHMTWTPAPGMTAKQIEKAVQRQAVLFEEKCKSRIMRGAVIDGSVKFTQFVNVWLADYAETQLRPTTFATYKYLLPRTIAAFGHLKMEEIQPRHIISFYDNLAECGVRNDIKYASKKNFSLVLKEKKLNKALLAKSAGISRKVLDSLTQGKNISESSANKIANALSVELSELFSAVNFDKGLSTRTILHYHQLLSSVFSTAVQWEVLFYNPCERVKPPRLEHNPPRYLDDQEAIQLIELIEKEEMQHKTMIKLFIFTGFRRGELCGLEWADINFEEHVININRTSIYLPALGVYTDETKTASSTRSIKAASYVFNMLQEYKTWQDERRKVLGDRWVPSNRLFTTWDGHPIYPSTITGWFQKFIKKHNLPDICIHSLRHTNATLLIANHVPISTVSQRLGHSDSSTTSRIYIHAIQSADAAAADIIGDVLNTVDKD